jgi:acetyl-CoA carboxylase biotin carboxyl carrier protein
MIDRERIREIIGLLKSSSSAELAVREGDFFVRVRRAPTAPARPAPVDPAATIGGPRRHDATATANGDPVVTAKLVGRFYRGKGPGQPALVSIGDDVETGQIIATIEALGKLTGVPAPVSGSVLEVLAEDGAAVGYGTPLLVIRRVEG